ncbi:MAG TPA: hypothetical protein ENI82_00440 [Bacteroidetes bacterium]|nr:hypothetical protein [Bacteroidota bacterium]
MILLKVAPFLFNTNKSLLMDKTNEPKEFNKFISLFPEVELPVTLSSEYVEIFSKYNKPIPEILIRKYILNEDIYIPENIDTSYEPEHLKEKTANINLKEISLDTSLEENDEENTSEEYPVEDEYIACLRLPGVTRFYGLVYLKIGILSYEYILHTYDKNGKTISNQMIASMKVENNVITEHVAMIDEDMIILIMEGDKNIQDNFNPENSHFLSFEIDDDGHISKYKL